MIWVADGAEVLADGGCGCGVGAGVAIVAHMLKVDPIGEIVVGPIGKNLTPGVGADGDGLGLQCGRFPTGRDFGWQDAGDIFFEGDGVDLARGQVATAILGVEMIGAAAPVL